MNCSIVIPMRFLFLTFFKHLPIVATQKASKKTSCLVYFIVSMVLIAGPAEGADNVPGKIVVGDFSSASAGGPFPSGWEPMVFKKIKQHTDYQLVRDEGTVVVRAVSNAASSGMIRKISIDPRAYPVVTWRWKTRSILEKGDVTQKSGDDYPARIYITFAYDGSKLGFLEKAKFKAAKLIYGEYPPTGAVNYIWSGKAPLEKSVPNAYTDRVMMVVVQSGGAELNTWVTERRNILEDYRRLFGGEPPMISGIAIMTDTDNTGESATTFYGDIVFHTSAHSALP